MILLSISCTQFISGVLPGRMSMGTHSDCIRRVMTTDSISVFLWRPFDISLNEFRCLMAKEYLCILAHTSLAYTFVYHMYIYTYLCIVYSYTLYICTWTTIIPTCCVVCSGLPVKATQFKEECTASRSVLIFLYQFVFGLMFHWSKCFCFVMYRS
jgi:hypothetical protein